MKAFSIFACDEFPEFDTSRKITDSTMRDELFGSHERITSLELTKKDYLHNNVTLCNVTHVVDYNRAGETLAYLGGEFQHVIFNNYFQTVEFPLYYNSDLKIVIIEAKKRVAGSFYSYVSKSNKFTHLKISRRKVDYDLLKQEIEEYYSVWFRDMKSQGVTAANLTGLKLTDHPHYQDFVNQGAAISSAIVPYVYENSQHRLQVTQDSGIVLIDTYQNTSDELSVLIKFVEEVLIKTWVDDDGEDINSDDESSL